MADGILQALVGPTQDTLNQHWAQGKAKSFGFQMMMKMGWSDGRGLGRELQGNAKHLTVSKKVDNAGLGSVKDETGNAGWTEASASFDSVLSKLNAHYGGQREAAQKKWEQKEKKRGNKSRKKEGGGTASGLLRHPKLLQSKNIRKYSAHDMQAILGIRCVDATPSSQGSGEGRGEAPSLWSALAGASSGACKKSDDMGSRTKEKRNKKKRERRNSICINSCSGGEAKEDGKKEETTKKSKKEMVRQDEDTDSKEGRAEQKQATKRKRREEKAKTSEAKVLSTGGKKKSKRKKDCE
ncbi:gpatch domain containing protein [Nannochloropsis oceanica]